MSRRLPIFFLISALLIALLIIGFPSFALTYTVNSTADTDDGSCTAALNGCTLREAINAANGSAGLDTIDFAIPVQAPTPFLQRVVYLILQTPYC